MTVHEVSRLAGISVRTLHYYDRIGLLRPVQVSAAGYRLYDETNLERLQQILLFRELQFPLKEIQTILDSPDFERNRALEQQITLLRLKKEHLENLIDLACGIKAIGVGTMDFSAFDTAKIDEYAAQAKAAWSKTAEYREFEEKSRRRTQEEQQRLGGQFMELFVKFGERKTYNPANDAIQGQVKELQNFIAEHFYTCSKEMLRRLGTMYASGGRFTEAIDQAGGEGTARFVLQAIEVYCTEA